MRVPVIATVMCLLAVVPGVGGAGRAAAQASPPPLLARDLPMAATLPTAFERTRIASPVAPRSDAAFDGERAGAQRSPLVAGVLGIVPGLGHIYAGEPGRGLLVAGVWFGSGLVAFSSSNTTVSGAGGVVLLGTSVFSIVDAVRAADRYNRRHERQTPGVR